MQADGVRLHPVSDEGRALDATFELATLPVFEIVYHHKVGGARAMNADYHEGLELLLSRMASIGGAILGVSVDSSVARELAPQARELPFDFPLEVDASTDAHELRLSFTRAMKGIARRPDAKPGGGNDQKRILLTFTLNQALAPAEVERLLVGRES